MRVAVRNPAPEIYLHTIVNPGISGALNTRNKAMAPAYTQDEWSNPNRWERGTLIGQGGAIMARMPHSVIVGIMDIRVASSRQESPRLRPRARLAVCDSRRQRAGIFDRSLIRGMSSRVDKRMSDERSEIKKAKGL